MFFQWFPMVANHWSDDGMVTIHRSGLIIGNNPQSQFFLTPIHIKAIVISGFWPERQSSWILLPGPLSFRQVWLWHLFEFQLLEDGETKTPCTSIAWHHNHHHCYVPSWRIPQTRTCVLSTPARPPLLTLIRTSHWKVCVQLWFMLLSTCKDIAIKANWFVTNLVPQCKKTF